MCPRLGSVRYLMTVLALAAAYCIAGRLGLLLAIPPGYASGIWPPSGIALAGTLVWGYGVWPGIALGSFLVNISTSFDATSVASVLRSVALASSIGIGAALQALGSAFLVKRCVGFPSPLTQARDIGTFLVLGGPVGCLINATIGVTSLLVGGVIPRALYLFSWWTWWVGDTIGVLIVTPLVLVWIAEPQQIWRSRRLSLTLPLTVTLTVVIVFFVYANAWDRNRVRLGFERQAESLGQTLQASFDDYRNVLHAIESFYASTSRVERHEFRTFVQRLLARHPGIQALSWDRRVPDTQRAVYEEAVRQEGYADFQITEQNAQGQLVRAAQRPEYVSVSYIEPHAGNESVLGYDVLSGPGRLEALHRARDTGGPSATGRIRLVQETGQQAGLLIFLPIYDNGLPHENMQERRQNLRGYATGVFRIGDMVDASLPAFERKGMTLQLYDETAPTGERRLYPLTSSGLGGTDHTSGTEHVASPFGLQWSTTMGMAGRRWTLHFASTLAYLAVHQTWQPWLVLVGGLLFTSLLGGFLLVTTGHTATIEQLVSKRTAELSQANTTLEDEIAERKRAESRFSSIAESAVEAIISTDSQGHILTWNNGARVIFGYTADEIVGQALSIFMPERYREAHQRGLERIQATGEPHLIGQVLTLHGLHKDGREFPVELTLSTWTTTEGRFYGGIIRDITERRRAEEELQRSAALLQALINNTTAIVHVKSAEGRYLLVNTKFEQLYNTTNEQLIGKTAYEVLPKELADRLQVIDRQVLQSRQAIQKEEWAERPDGRHTYIVLKFPLLDARGEPYAICGISTDITERKQMEEDLRSTAADLARSNADLAQFAYVASHDLQEPLRAVAGCLQLLQARYPGQFDARGEEFFRHAVEGAQRMQTLINDLLQYARVGSRGGAFVPTDCTTVLQQALANLKVAIEESGAVITHDPLPIVPADATQLLQVFQNLLSNALKFRGDKPPAIHIGVEKHDGAWQFAVCDNGIGIDLQHTERIFVIFQRLHTRSEYPGTGIGLALCKKIVERHGGCIWVESTPEQGATFFFTISEKNA